MPSRSPLTPIFAKEVQYGQVTTGAMVGDPWVPPAISFCDDFNRSNSGDITNGGGFPWVELTGDGGLGVSSNRLVGPPTQAAARAFWNQDLTSDDHWVESDMAVVLSGIQTLYIRANTSGPSNPTSYYDTSWTSASGGTITTRKILSGSPTTVNTTTGVGTLTDGTRVRFQAQGSTLKVFWDGVLKVAFTDSSIPTGRYAGVRVDVLSAAIDNFCCGPIAPPTPASPSPSLGLIVDFIDFGSPYACHDLELMDGDTIFAAGQYADHSVVDRSNPYDLTVAGTTPRSGEAYWVAKLDGTRVVVPWGTNGATAGLRTISVATPSSPSVVQTLLEGHVVPQAKFGAYIPGQYFVIEDGEVGSDHLTVFNAGTIGSFSFNSITAVASGGRHWPRMAFDGRYLYGASPSNGLFEIFDLNALPTITLAGSVSIPSVGRPTIIENAGVADYVIVGYQSGGGDIEIGVVDVTNKAAPTLVNTILSAGGGSIFVNDTLIVASSTTMSFYDASALPTLTLISSFAHGFGATPEGMRWDGDRFVYMAVVNGVAVMELSGSGWY